MEKKKIGIREKEKPYIINPKDKEYEVCQPIRETIVVEDGQIKWNCRNQHHERHEMPYRKGETLLSSLFRQSGAGSSEGDIELRKRFNSLLDIVWFISVQGKMEETDEKWLEKLKFSEDELEDMAYLKNPEYQDRIKKLGRELDNKEITCIEYKRKADKLMKLYRYLSEKARRVNR